MRRREWRAGAKIRRQARLLVAAFAFVVAGAGADASDYEVGHGDVLHIAVLDQQEMTGDFAVDPQGMITFPFLGRVKVSEMTTAELERKITTLLSDGYLKRPKVAVVVKEFHSRRVYVTGEVMKPGAYGLHPDQSLLGLVGDIGDFTPNVGHEVIVIRPPSPNPPMDPTTPLGDTPPSPENKPSPSPRPGPLFPGETSGSQVFHVALRELRSGNPDQDFKLEPGDTVFFPKAAEFYVTGYVNRAGSFPYQEGTTVYQALALAGGVSDRGSAGGVKIVRLQDGKRKELKVKPTDLVLPEDTIVVPERFF
jgi:polysaccharide export outer membrane protein